jgi:hypothetical protein
MNSPPIVTGWEPVIQLPSPYKNSHREYRVNVEGQKRGDGTWAGRLVFVSAGEARRTAQETSQPNREALEYWATGLEPVYLEGAFKRAR